MHTIDSIFEEIKVAGQELVDKVKALIHEGNVRRIIIKDEHGHTFVEIPVTVAAVGAVLHHIGGSRRCRDGGKVHDWVEKAPTPNAGVDRSEPVPELRNPVPGETAGASVAVWSSADN